MSGLATESPEVINDLIKENADFILNITAQWCPDCTERQAPLMEQFTVDAKRKLGVDVIPLMVQSEKGVYVSDWHEALVVSLGGHGFPRTVLYIGGVPVSTHAVEYVLEEQLQALLDEFSKQF